MNPVVIGNATLYLGDCREVSQSLGHFDACVTDPPYGIRHRAQKGAKPSKLKGMLVKEREWTGRIEGDDEPFDPTWLLETFRFPSLILWGANHFADKLPASKAWIVWDKRRDVAPDDNADCEMAWTNLSGTARIFRHLWKGIVREGEENIGIGGAKLHPNQKPVALMDYCITRCALRAGQRVFDPYMGCATVGVAALRRGIAYVGCEIDPEHFETACRRIEDAQRQGRLIA
jgi:site-specific DNA-methyltransferase (adenine-specific)